MSLFAGQGKLYLASVVNGVPGVFDYIGYSDNVSFDLTVEADEYVEQESGSRLLAGRMVKAKKGALKATLRDFNDTVLQLALHGTRSTVTGSTVTAEVLPQPVAVAQAVRLAKANVSSVVVTDSTGSPKTLPAGQYAVAKHGMVTFNDITTGGPYVQPFKAAYTYGAATQVGMFTTAVPRRWVRFVGINTADNNKEVLVDLYKCDFDPANNFALKSESFAQWEIGASVLYDETRAADTTLGQFGAIVLM